MMKRDSLKRMADFSFYNMQVDLRIFNLKILIYYTCVLINFLYLP